MLVEVEHCRNLLCSIYIYHLFQRSESISFCSFELDKNGYNE
jgi:hypothetical protein